MQPSALKLVVLGRFSQASGDARRVPIDKDSFPQVLAQLADGLRLQVPNRLGGPSKEISVLLPLREIRSFRPEAVAESVPELQELLGVRQMLIRLRDRKLSLEDFQARLRDLGSRSGVLDGIRSILEKPEQPPALPGEPSGKEPSESASQGGSLDSLLEMVDIAKSESGRRRPSEAATASLDRLLSVLTTADPSGASVDPELSGRAVTQLDAALSAQLNEILRHPEFRRLEAAWRGLKFLVDRADFREPIQIEIISASREAVVEILEGLSPDPDFILADYEFSHSQQDVALLEEIGSKAEWLQAPFVASAGTALLGLASVKEAEGLSSLKALFEGPDLIKWHAFRRHGASRWVALLYNRFLLRLPYGPDQAPVKTFDFQEALKSDADYLWGNPVWVLAARLTDAFAKTAWCARIAGGVVADLPVREVQAPGGRTAQTPLEALLTEEKEADLSENGIAALVCRPNSDEALLLSAPAVHQPERYSDPQATRLSLLQSGLAYQATAARLARLIGRIAAEIPTGRSPAQVRQFVADTLLSRLSVGRRVPADAVEVEVGETPERPDRYEASVTIRPDRAGLGPLGPLTFSLPVGK